MELVIITGMSGAGKATAAKALEEAGFTTVDNIPPSLVAGLIDVMGGPESCDKLCVVIDARCGKLLNGLASAVSDVRATGVGVRVLFLDASDSVLVQRYSETRKHHPFGTESMGILSAVEHERGVMQQARLLSDTFVDTTELKPDQLRQQIVAGLEAGSDGSGLLVTLTSFGFKFGLPIDVDLLFDVRFLVNPHYVDELRPYDGRNKIIDDFVMQDPGSQTFLDKIVGLLEFALPRYVEEGKSYLTVGIGCTGGRHRSVVIAEHIGAALRQLGYQVVNNHRDVSK